jgi:branched-chain amino acid transport system permease protein
VSELLATLLFLAADGLIWGSLIALIALGLSLIYGIMGIINMAHGDFFMVGAAIAVAVTGWLGAFWPALLIAPLVVGVLALPLERWVLRPFEGRPLLTLVGTIGLSFVIQQVALMVFGGTPRTLAEPVQFVVAFPGVALPGYRVVAAVAGLVVVAGLWLVVYRTDVGVRIRATMAHPEIADAIGIDTSRVRVLTFGLGAALAAVAGVLAAPITQVFYLMGNDVLLFSYIVVIVGGLGSLAGAVAAALALSSVEALLTAVVSPVEARAAMLLVMAMVLLVRPRGLFA